MRRKLKVRQTELGDTQVVINLSAISGSDPGAQFGWDLSYRRPKAGRARPVTV
jgi:hypothetical protein